MEEQGRISMPWKLVCVKQEPECVFNEHVHVKKEEGYMKEDMDWEDNTGFCGVSEAAARAGLYAGHEVKDELVLGPEVLQPPDMLFTHHAQASDVREQPVLRDCVVRLQRIDHHEALLRTDTCRGTAGRAARLTSHADNHSDVPKDSNTDNTTEKESYVCDICKKMFSLKTELLQHVMLHIHLSPGQEESRRSGGDSVHIKKEEEYMKEETEWEDNTGFRGVSEAAARAGLYAGHEVKDEPALDPALLRRADTVSTHHAAQTPDAREQPVLRDCVVRLERVVVDYNSHTKKENGSTYISPDKEPYVCDICKKSFTRKTQLIKHIVIHTDVLTSTKHETMPDSDVLSLSALGLRDCSVRLLRCGGGLRGEGGAHTSPPAGGINPYECDMCGDIFQHKIILIRHIRLHLQVNSGRELCSCVTCGRQFASKAGLNYHKKTHAGYTSKHSCDTCGRWFICRQRLSRHMQTHDENKKKPFSCKICNMAFVNKGYLDRHGLVHTGERAYSCRICKKKFLTSCGLSRHARVHTGEKLHACEICKKKFVDFNYLKLHKRIHTGEKLYSCEICKRQFTLPSVCKKHKKTHITKLKPFSCDMCDKKFGQLNKLMRHHQVHITHPCRVCGKKFRRWDHLQTHQLVHSGVKPFSCEICNKRFTQSTHLKTHQRMHTGEKPYPCEICKKSFKESGALNVHKRIHTGEKPYFCVICNKKFRQWGELHRHKRSHAKQK